MLDHLGEDHCVERVARVGQWLLVDIAEAHLDTQAPPKLGALVGEQVDPSNLVAGAAHQRGLDEVVRQDLAGQAATTLAPGVVHHLIEAAEELIDLILATGLAALLLTFLLEQEEPKTS